MVALTIVNEILKVDYIEVVRDVLNSATVLNHRLEKDFESVQGEMVYIGLNTGRNPSFSSRAITATGTGAALPARGEQSYASTQFQIPENYGRLLVRERDIKASRNSKGALIRVLDTEMRHLIRDAKNALNKQNFSDHTGSLCREESNSFAAGTGLTTIVLQTEHQRAGQAVGTAGTYYGTKFLEPGMSVELGTTQAAAVIGPYTIVSVSPSGNSFTVATDITAGIVADDYVHVAGSWTTDQMGLMKIVDDGDGTRGFDSTLQAIDRSTAGNEFWQANVLRGAGGSPPALRAITLDLMQEAIDTSEIAGDGEVTAFLTTYGLRRELLALLVADKRFVAPYEMDLDGGFRALSYNGIPVIPDRHCPKHQIFCLDEPTIRFYQMSDFEWMEEDGAVLNRIDGSAAYEATLFLYREMATTDPKNNVRIDDLVDPTSGI